MYKIIVSPDMTLYQALRKIVTRYPNRPALSFQGQTLTFRELSDKVDALVAELEKKGLRSGGKLAVLLPNSLEFVYAFFAPAALGAAVVPLDPSLKARDLDQILEDSACSHVLAEPVYQDQDLRSVLENSRSSLPNLKHILWRSELNLDPPGDEDLSRGDQKGSFGVVSPDATAALFYTSGTTGVPKAVAHSHRTLLSSITQGQSILKRGLFMQLVVLVKLAARHGPRLLRMIFNPVSVLSPAPLHLLLAYGPLLDSLLLGHRFVIGESFHPGKTLELIEKEKVGVLIVSPTMTIALLKSRELGRRNLSSLFAVMIGSAPCPPELVRRASRAFRCSIHIVFGATEIGGSSLMTTAFDPHRMRLETVGRPLLRNMTKIVDDQRREIPRGTVGELAQRLPSNMLGYHNSPSLTAGALDEEGWYYTGDQAVMDGHGYVRIVGRKKDMIIRGGQNVFPAEIEQFLLSRPGIKNTAAVGLPHPFLGESLCLFVELQEDSPLTAEGIMALCREHLSPSKRPDCVKLVDALPVTASGKVQKYLLKDMAAAHE
jgi:fatty-acyl-CoA synthase